MKIVAVLKRLRSFPTFLLIALAYVDAADDAKKGDYRGAEKKLRRAFSFAAISDPQAWPSQLLMARIALRLGNWAEAAAIVPVAIKHVRPSAFASRAECAYVRYASKLIYEEAKRLSGEPTSLNVGVTINDLDLSKVRRAISDDFPLLEGSPEQGQTVH